MAAKIYFVYWELTFAFWKLNIFRDAKAEIEMIAKRIACHISLYLNETTGVPKKDQESLTTSALKYLELRV